MKANRAPLALVASGPALRGRFRPAAVKKAAAAALWLLGSCAAPSPPPPPAPLPPRPAPPPLPVAPPVADWHDAPATPGEWSWQREGQRSVARFAVPGQPAQLRLSCEPLARTVTLTMLAQNANGHTGVDGTATILTTSLSRAVVARTAGDGALTITLASRDPLLDAMAFSRGRFAVRVAGLALLALPAWPEISRVIDDCR